jgi:hypothetical protein
MTSSKRISWIEAEGLQLQAQREGVLLVWTIYKHPRDFPDRWVARPHVTGPHQMGPLRVHLEAESLDELRERLPKELHRVQRSPADEVQIFESWI